MLLTLRIKKDIISSLKLSHLLGLLLGIGLQTLLDNLLLFSILFIVTSKQVKVIVFLALLLCRSRGRLGGRGGARSLKSKCIFS